MDALSSSPIVLPLSSLTPMPTVAGAKTVGAIGAPGTPPAATTAQHARIDKSAQSFEASFLSIMLGQMMDGVKTSTFGGGEGEDAFKSFLTDAMAKSMAKHGGVGLSKILSTEMLKMQGLS